MFITVDLFTPNNKIDMASGGIIRGTATIEGQPNPARIIIFRRFDYQLIAHQKTDNDGTYFFNGIPRGIEYTVLGLDLNKQNNAVVADRITPVDVGDL